MIHHVTAGQSLQGVLDSAQAGDTIALDPTATFTGQFRFPPKTGLVRLTSQAQLQEQRITPADAGLLPTLVSGVAAHACDFQGSRNWALDSIRFLPNREGAGEVISIQDGHSITLQRLLFVVPLEQQQKRFILGNGQHIRVVQSHVQGVWKSGQDSQAFVAWHGAGPYTITDNFLEAASENVMFGGADSQSSDRIPSDILVEGNHFTKDLAWKGQPRNVKNLFELKSAKRVTVRGNTFEHNWADGQSGRAIVFTPRNQDGSAPWSVIEDVVFEQNIVRDTPMGFNILGYDDEGLSQQTERIVIRDNDIAITGNMVFIALGEVGRLEVYRNRITVPSGAALLYVSQEGTIRQADGSNRTPQYAIRDLVWAENIASGGYIHAPEARDEAALQLHTKTYSFQVPTTDTPPQPDPPELPEPTDPEPQPDIIGPDVRLAVLYRSGKSHNWHARADTDATDVSTVEFFVNDALTRTMISAPFGTTLSLKGYRGTVTVRVRATDTAGNIGTASRTVVLP